MARKVSPGVTVHEPKKGLADGNAVNYLISRP